MKEILFNLALIDTLTYCQKSGIDPSGSYLKKAERGYTYTLYRTNTKKPIVSVTFKKSSAPTHTTY